MYLLLTKRRKRQEVKGGLVRWKMKEEVRRVWRRKKNFEFRCHEAVNLFSPYGKWHLKKLFRRQRKRRKKGNVNDKLCYHISQFFVIRTHKKVATTTKIF